MKKIRIIEKEELPESFVSVEREVLYKELFQSHKLDTRFIDGFLEIDAYTFEHTNRFHPSNLFFVNIKKILNYALPVVTKHALIDKDKNRKHTATKYITIQLEYPIFSFVLDGTTLIPLIIPSDTKFEILGFVFPQSTPYTMVPSYFHTHVPFEFDPFQYTRALFSYIQDPMIKQKWIRTLFPTVLIQHPFLSRHTDKSTGVQYTLLEESKYQKNEIYTDILQQIHTYIKHYQRADTTWFERYTYQYYYLIRARNLQQYESFQKALFDPKHAYIYQIKKWNDVPFIKMFNTVSSIWMNVYYTSSMYMVLQMIQEKELYDRYMIYGISHISVQSSLKRIQYKKDQNRIIQENFKKIASSQLQQIHLERIARTTFPELFNMSSKKCIFKKSDIFQLTKIPSSIRTTITMLYEKQQSLLSQYMSNTCEHRKYLRMFHMYPSVQTFKQLKKYIKASSKKEGILSCSLCSFDLLCIHDYEYYEQLEKIQKEESFEKEYIVKNNIVEKYKGTVPIQFTFYCRICSKELGKSADNEQYTAFVGEKLANAYIPAFDDEVNKRLVYYTKDIVTKYIDVSQLNVSKKKFTYKIVSIVFPFIKEMDDKLQKAVTLIDKQVILDIHIMIFVFSCIAYISSLVRFVLINTKIGGKAAPKHVADLAIIRTTFSIAHSIITKTIEYKKSNITKDKVRQLLIEYYRSISTKDIQLEESIQSNYDIIHSILNSTIYQYIVSTHYILQPTTKKKSMDITYFLQKKKETLLHIKDRKKTPLETYHTLLHNLYDTVRLPFSIKEINITAITTPQEHIMIAFLQTMYYYISKGLYMVSPYTSNDSLSSPIQSIRQDYDTMTRMVQEYENTKRDEAIIQNTSVMFSLPSVNYRENDYVLHAYHTIYCLDGQRHQFQYDTNHKKGKQCIRCTKYLVDIEKEDDKTITKHNAIINTNLSDKNDSTIFFHLYFNACPKNANHVFVSKTNRCRFCGVTKQELIDQDPEYYRKFKSTFKSHFQKKQESFIQHVRHVSASIPVSKKSTSQEKIKLFKLETLKTSILELSQVLSKKFKCEPYQLEYLGCFENILYEPVPSLYVQKKLDEYVSTNISSRVNILLQHNLTCGIYYRILKNIHPFYRHATDDAIGQFLHSVKDKAYSFKKLPIFELDVSVYYTFYHENQTDDETLGNILLYILLKNFLDLLHKSMKTPYEKEIYAFIDILLKKFIYQDQLYSQHDIRFLQFKKKEKKEELEEELPMVEYEDEDIQEDNLFSYDYLDIDSDILGDGYDIDRDID